MIKILAQNIYNKIDLSSFELSESYFYNGIPLCVIDAIFSIGVRYESVQNVITNFCDYTEIKKYRDSKVKFPSIDEQYKVSDFIKSLGHLDPERLARDVFKNNQRTSSRNGILKSEAVFNFLSILYKHKIDTFQDLKNMNIEVESEIKSIKGQNSGISLQYFYMLSGSNELIKPDRMIIRFLKENLNRQLGIDEALDIITKTCRVLKTDFSIEITPRELDNAIWNYQRKRYRS